MADRMIVWSLNPAMGKDGACQYYRIHIPLLNLQRMGYIYFYEAGNDNTDADRTAMIHSDIVHLYSIQGAPVLHQVKVLNDIKPKSDGRQMRFPPISIYDADDNTDFVHPMNYTYAGLGVRSYPDARLLRPGENLEWEGPDGKRYPFWQDGITKKEGVIFDIARNLFEMKTRHELIRICAGATVTTPALAGYFREVIGQPNVHVYPNTVDLRDYENFDVQRADDKIRIFWQGSESHWIDWYRLGDALDEISQKYRDKIKWVIYGKWFDWVHGLIPDDMIEHRDWDNHNAYKLRRGLLNIDINLCPLADNAFNRCKSAIKWYEASIWKNPEATLAANVEPYREIQDGKTGMLYSTSEEFVSKLSSLIDNAELRKTIADGAKKWVLANRVPEKTLPAVYDFYDELKMKQRSELAPRVKPGTNAEIKRLAAQQFGG